MTNRVSLCQLPVILLFWASNAAAQAAPPAVTVANTQPKGRAAIVADGTIQNVLKGEDQTTPTSGSLGFTFFSATGKERFAAFITVVNALDTLRGNTVETFGSSLLTTGTTAAGGGFSSFTADYQRFFDYGGQNQRFGPRAYLGYAQTVWRAGPDVAAKAATFGVVSGGVRAFWTPINLDPNNAAKNSLAFTVEGGVTVRSLVGDELSDDFLTAALGNTARTYWGPEANATIQVRQLSLFALVTSLHHESDKVAGLTGFRGQFGFSLDAPIFVF